MLLVSKQDYDDFVSSGTGNLYVFDVSADELVVQWAFSMDSTPYLLPVCWCPALNGLIPSSHAKLEDGCIYNKKDLPVGTLQDDYKITIRGNGRGFAPDGLRLAACSLDLSAQSDPESDSDVDELAHKAMLGVTGIFRCRPDEQAITCVLEAVFEGMWYTWMPCSSRLLQHSDSTHTDFSCITSVQSQEHGLTFPDLSTPVQISPSQDFLATSPDFGVPAYLLCGNTGRELWADDSGILAATEPCACAAVLPQGDGLLYTGHAAVGQPGIDLLHFLTW